MLIWMNCTPHTYQLSVYIYTINSNNAPCVCRSSQLSLCVLFRIHVRHIQWMMAMQLHQFIKRNNAFCSWCGCGRGRPMDFYPAILLLFGAGAGYWLQSPLLFYYFRRHFSFWQIFRKLTQPSTTLQNLKWKCVTTNRPKTFRWNA